MKRQSKFWSRFPALDLRLATSLVGIVGQGIAWACAIIAIFFVSSNMPPLFHRIPAEIQFACEALVFLAAVLLMRMLFERRRALRAFALLSDSLSRFRPTGRQDRDSGVPAAKMERLRDACEFLTGSPRDWWLAIDDALEYYESPVGPDGEGGGAGWFLTRPIREILTDEDMVEPFYHATFHQAVPGILTALGLLATFSAILVALAGVSYNAANTVQPVTGIDSLINGLAGKFLSSIIALILSMIFTFVEKKACERRIYREVDALRNLVVCIFPFLSQTRILLDLQHLAIQQLKPKQPEVVEEKPVEAASEAPAELPETWAAAVIAEPPPPVETSPAQPREDDALATQFGV